MQLQQVTWRLKKRNQTDGIPDKTAGGRMRSVTCWILLVFGLWVFVGCEVTEEKISLWKGTENGPKKLASTIVDSKVPLDLRAKAAVALVEINAWERFRDAFKKMEEAEAASVVDRVVPMLAEKVEAKGTAFKGRGTSTISKLQVDAKDGLYLLLDYAGEKGKREAEKALIVWFTKDYNTRAMAGQYNTKAIVKKIGPNAAMRLIPLLDVDRAIIKQIAELIREVNDKTVLANASVHLAAELKNNLGKIDEKDFSAASVIGGGTVADVLLDVATNHDLSAELRRHAVRALSVAVQNKAMELTDSHMARLFALAESRKLDRYQREETYYVIAQAGRTRDLPRIRRLLTRKDPFWRAVGLGCVLRIDGEGQLEAVLRQLERQKRTRKSDDVDEIILRVSSFPNLLPQVRELLGSPSSFIRGVAIGVLGRIGTGEDAENMTKLFRDKTKLPKGFKYKTLDSAARAAVQVIEKRG
jgi:hypothetical protein